MVLEIEPIPTDRQKVALWDRCCTETPQRKGDVVQYSMFKEPSRF